MKHYQRVRKYGQRISSPWGGVNIKSPVANWGGIWRNALRVAFGGANLFPLPVNRPSGSTFLIHTTIGRKVEKDRSIKTTFHLRKTQAYRLLKESIIAEANDAIRPRLVNEHGWSPVSVAPNIVWRHTGGTGNFARNFLVEAGGELWLLVKLKSRYNLFHGGKEILANIPDHLFPSALDALYKFEQTGCGVWFPESRDEWVRENFPLKNPPWRMPDPAWYRSRGAEEWQERV